VATKTEHETRFAERVRKVRQHRGMSCQRLADVSGFTRAALSKIECGERRVSLGEAIQLAEALGVSLEAMCSPDPLVVHLEAVVE